MKKILRIYLTIGLILVGAASLVLIDYFRDYDPYVYENIFFLTPELWSRSRVCAGFPGRVIQLKDSEIAEVSKLLANQGFGPWRSLDGHDIYVEGGVPKFFALAVKSPPVFSTNFKAGLRGRFSVALLSPTSGELVLVVSDGVL